MQFHTNKLQYAQCEEENIWHFQAKTLQVSGSVQFKEHHLPIIFAKIKEICKNKLPNLWILDLSAKQHCFINGAPVVWKNETKFQETAKLLTHESARISQLNKTVLIGDSLVDIKTISSEEKLVESNGFQYARFPMLGRGPLSEQCVENLIQFVIKNPNAWLHIHSSLHKSTTLIAMINMLYNALNMSLEDILTENSAQNLEGKDLGKYFECQAFLEKFYTYCRLENPLKNPTAKSWAKWSSEPIWLNKYLQIDEGRKAKILKEISDRKVKKVQIAEKEISFGLSQQINGYFHEKLMDIVYSSMVKYAETAPFLFMEIGGGAGYVAADVALMMDTYQNQNPHFKGKALVCEPTIPKEANQYIFNFLKAADIKKIKEKDLYKVSPEPFPECVEKTQETSHFKKQFDVIHCRNVLHFFPPIVADRFFKQLFTSLKPGGFAVIAAKAPYKMMYLSERLTQEEVAETMGSVLRDYNKSVKKEDEIEGKSSLDYYNSWKEKKDYPGYCVHYEFFYCQDFVNNLEPLEYGRCSSSYPSQIDLKMENYAKEESIVIAKGGGGRVEAIKTFKNLFTAEQFESIAKKFGMTIIESGYLEAEGTPSKLVEIKVSHAFEIANTSLPTAYIVLQKPFNIG